MSNYKILGTGIVAIVLMAMLVLAVEKLFSAPPEQPASAVVPTTSGDATGLTNLSVTGYLCQGGPCTGLNLTQTYSVGSCAVGTTTLFAVASPFAATSTATLEEFFGTSATGTIDYRIGTSTKTTGLASTDVSASYANIYGVATSAPFFIRGGFNPGTATVMGTYESAGTTTLATTVIVNPNESVVGYATSSSQHASYQSAITGSGTTSGVSCTYVIKWAL